MTQTRQRANDQEDWLKGKSEPFFNCASKEAEQNNMAEWLNSSPLWKLFHEGLVSVLRLIKYQQANILWIVNSVCVDSAPDRKRRWWLYVMSEPPGSPIILLLFLLDSTKKWPLAFENCNVVFPSQCGQLRIAEKHEILCQESCNYLCLCVCICESKRERENFKDYEHTWQNETAGVLYHLSFQLRVKHAVPLYVMNNMQIRSQSAVTLSDWSESCC